ncbi:GNAT family N-acetyltransferase [Frankia sp. AiPa1]|uniref:GNAT family N-acetyltransferase n=1 Tax=Frankia sp. AiPa1 TaxID=573492 RepID=UPI00202AC93C|nr:GNAT family N-acetyltransferase [Frankia sp. AiPa1]MCL9761383.1 GNAT family N-acetyltransferase [Frankia sp. AiPa1]
MRPVSPPPPGHLTFRAALETDGEVEAIVALVQSAYRGQSSRAGWTTEADLLGGQRTDESEVRDAVSDRYGVVLLATDPAGGLVGCCHVQRRIEPPTSASASAHPEAEVSAGAVGAYFGMFAVRPDLQGGGVGRELLARAEQHAVGAWSAGWMEMLVIAQRSELLDWYRRRGYLPTSRTRPFPYDDRRFGEPLRPDLYFVVLRRQLG